MGVINVKIIYKWDTDVWIGDIRSVSQIWINLTYYILSYYEHD